MPAGIAAQYGFLYQRYAFINLTLENAGMNRFFVYEGVDDIDIIEENRICAVRDYNKQFVQIKSGTVSQDCWAKVIGNWLLIEGEKPNCRVILEKELSFNYKAEDVLNRVFNYFVAGSEKASTSIANKVYKKCLDGKDEATFKRNIIEIVDNVFIEVLSMERLNASIAKTFQSVYCSDIIKYEMAKISRCERFIQYINSEIDEAFRKKNSFTLRYDKFMSIINKVSAEISDGKYIIDIGEMKKQKKMIAEQLVSSDSIREVRQLRMVNSRSGFIINELVKELLYRDLRAVYADSSSTLISNIEEEAYSNFEDVIYSLSEDAEPRQVFEKTMGKDIPLEIVDNSPLYKNGCYVYLTSEESKESRQISWGKEHE